MVGQRRVEPGRPLEDLHRLLHVSGLEQLPPAPVKGRRIVRGALPGECRRDLPRWGGLGTYQFLDHRRKGRQAPLGRDHRLEKPRPRRYLRLVIRLGRLDRYHLAVRVPDPKPGVSQVFVERHDLGADDELPEKRLQIDSRQLAGQTRELRQRRVPGFGPRLSETPKRLAHVADEVAAATTAATLSAVSKLEVEHELVSGELPPPLFGDLLAQARKAMGGSEVFPDTLQRQKQMEVS